MALSAAIYTTLTTPVATGVQAYAGVGFQPKALIVWGCAAESTGTFSHAELNWAVAAGSNSDFGVSVSSEDGVGSTDVVSRQDIRRTINHDAQSPGIGDWAAALTSFDADGFTLNYSVVGTSSRTWNCLAFGGDDFASAAVGSFTVVSSLGNQSITGVGFRPTAVIFSSARPAVAGDGASVGFRAYLGMAVYTNSNQGVSAFANRDANAAGTGNSLQRTSLAITQFVDKTVQAEANLTGFDVDGFSLNWSTLNAGSTLTCYYAAFTGGQWAQGSFTQSTTTGVQTVTGVGFTPRGTLLQSCCNAATNGSVVDSKLAIGAAVGTNSRLAAWCGGNLGADPTQEDRDQDPTSVLRMLEPGATPTVVGDADYASNDNDGFTLNWDTADGTAREILYLCFGDNPAAPAAAATDTDSYVLASY